MKKIKKHLINKCFTLLITAAINIILFLILVNLPANNKNEIIKITEENKKEENEIILITEKEEIEEIIIGNTPAPIEEIEEEIIEENEITEITEEEITEEIIEEENKIIEEEIPVEEDINRSEEEHYIFETTKARLTAYSYTDSTHEPTTGTGTVWGESAAYSKKLIPIYDNSDLEIIYIEGNKKIVPVHSCAVAPQIVDQDLLPAGSIVYIKELDLYFRVDDNIDYKTGKEKMSDEYLQGASIWFDIYLGRAAFEGYQGILDYGAGIKYVEDENGNLVCTGIPNTPDPNNIYWADYKNNFLEDQIEIIKKFFNNYYSASSFTFIIYRYGYSDLVI